MGQHDQGAAVNEDCLKLTTYFGERDRTEHGLFSDELMNVYGDHRVQASVLLRGTGGFGRLHHLHTDRLLTLSEDLPVVSIAVDERLRIESMLESVLQIQRKGLITLERARLLSGEIGTVELPEQLNEATKLTIYVAGRSASVERRPLSPSATSSIGGASPARVSYSAWTARVRATGPEHTSLPVTPTSRR